MKRMISRRLTIVILATMVITLLFNYSLLLLDARHSWIRSSQIKINQIEQILKQNTKEIEQIRQALKDDSIIRAKAAAYILQHQPEILDSPSEIQKIADLLQVDEFHLFDQNGLLYNGSQPKYFGYTFNSGEQMRAFLPMLEDKSMIIAQDMTPNTAEQKMMQYTAVWMENGENIVQIGIAPKQLLEAMAQTELSHIFSTVTPEEGTTIYVIDKESHIISGSTNTDYFGLTAEEIGLVLPDQISESHGFSATIQDVPSFCVFRDTGDTCIGMSHNTATLDAQVRFNMLLVMIYLLSVSIIMIATITRYLDHYIISGINIINDKLQRITDGDLETTVNVSSTPEFSSLSSNMNQMVKSMSAMTSKLRHERDSDLLTELFSRRAFYRELGQRFEQPEQLGHSAILMLDLDNLKYINDTYGHSSGDIALRTAAALILQIVESPSDDSAVSPQLLAGRLSGDEFAAFLYGYSSQEALEKQIIQFYERMLETTASFCGNTPFPIRLSGGYVFCRDHSSDYMQMLHLADVALYQSKRSGKAKFTAYQPGMEKQ